MLLPFDAIAPSKRTHVPFARSRTAAVRSGQWTATLIDQPRYDQGIAFLEAVVAMLTKMITVDSST